MGDASIYLGRVLDHLRLANKRSSAVDHLVDAHAQSPPVYLAAVAKQHDHLWRKVLGGTAHRVAHLVRLLREPEINQFDEAAIGEDDVLWLQIAIEYALAVDVLKGGDEANRDGECLRLRQLLSTGVGASQQ
eukprot:CAMPEP_0181220716 /NCGR_PEP_ID=MMETSP1096-20121128/28988_1 /TAXON_ID=156174 ORGANISM="Chrysochromulina ericina, Strain CCMP281" /NCGR_SAMPLE_ID=MMETSP1096 /ASSEMBLY_ACC=CAM_ASM_000453 /LENGTH=131 /DNA_ID=CAMNT_0023313243 /DNA_START=914 /DNA_END=1309 /DNA_ORIENTATION=+